MNAVEIEEAVSALASSPFDAGELPYAFLAAFGNKDTTIKRLRGGSSNSSDVPGGVLQRNNIHFAVCPPGEVGATLAALRQSPRTTATKAKFVRAWMNSRLPRLPMRASKSRRRCWSGSGSVQFCKGAA
jgi:hypothetical protein